MVFRITKKPNYSLKAKVMATELPWLERKVSQALFFNTYDHKEPFTLYTKEEALTMKMVNEDLMPEEWKEAHRINKSYYDRMRRIRYHINVMLSICHRSNKKFRPIFLTFTFTDKVLASTSEKTRRTYVARFLKEHCIRYVANIDFGATNHREHYHACVMVDHDIPLTKWKYGALNAERVRISNDSTNKIPRYIAKLTNHAIKETTKRSCMLYSRNKKN